MLVSSQVPGRSTLTLLLLHLVVALTRSSSNANSGKKLDALNGLLKRGTLVGSGGSLEPVPLDVNSERGRTLATKTCGDIATAQARRLHANFHHNMYLKFDRVGGALKRPPHSVRPRWVEAGDRVAGVRAEEDDVTVDGEAFYGPAKPDYLAATFECLLSLDLTALKAIKFGPVTANPTD